MSPHADANLRAKVRRRGDAHREARGAKARIAEALRSIDRKIAAMQPVHNWRTDPHEAWNPREPIFKTPTPPGLGEHTIHIHGRLGDYQQAEPYPNRDGYMVERGYSWRREAPAGLESWINYMGRSWREHTHTLGPARYRLTLREILFGW